MLTSIENTNKAVECGSGLGQATEAKEGSVTTIGLVPSPSPLSMAGWNTVEDILIQSSIIPKPRDKHSEDVEILNPSPIQNLPRDEASKLNSNLVEFIIPYGILSELDSKIIQLHPCCWHSRGYSYGLD